MLSEQIERWWHNACVQQRLPHSLILAGTDMPKRHTLAWRLSKHLLCDTPTDKGACGQCHNCQHFTTMPAFDGTQGPMESVNQHPDWVYVSPKEAGKEIVIDDVRAMIPMSEATSMVAKSKVIWIDQANKLNQASANCLLKTLEEPPGDTYFLLLTPSTQGMLDTILSRCQVLRMSEGHTTDTSRTQSPIYQLTQQQQWDRMVSQLSEDAKLSSRKLSLSEKRHLLNQSLDTMCYAARDAIAGSTPDGVEAWVNINDVLIGAKRNIQAYVKPELIIEDAAIKLRRL